MATKNAILRQKIDGIMYNLLVQSTGDIVTLSDGTTLSAKIAQIVSTFDSIITENIIDEKISTSSTSLYEKVTGFNSDTSINEAYDTIKEIADWLNTDAPTSAQDIINELGDLTEAISTLETNATIVEASETNGSIKVNNEDVTVYTHPETHSAEMIEETDTKKFVTPEEKEAWNNKDLIPFINASSTDADYSILDTATGCVISIDDISVTITYTNVDNETINVSDGVASILAEVGSSKYVEFTLPEGYTVNSIASVVGETESNVEYSIENNKVSFIIKNIGNLSIGTDNIPVFSDTQSIKVILSLV